MLHQCTHWSAAGHGLHSNRFKVLKLVSERRYLDKAWAEIAVVISTLKETTKSVKMAEKVKSGSFLTLVKVITTRP